MHPGIGVVWHGIPVVLGAIVVVVGAGVVVVVVVQSSESSLAPTW
jgi:hypothetical protein